MFVPDVRFDVGYMYIYIIYIINCLFSVVVQIYMPDVANKIDSKLVTYLYCHVPEGRPAHSITGEYYDRKEEIY